MTRSEAISLFLRELLLVSLVISGMSFVYVVAQVIAWIVKAVKL